MDTNEIFEVVLSEGSGDTENFYLKNSKGKFFWLLSANGLEYESSQATSNALWAAAPGKQLVYGEIPSGTFEECFCNVEMYNLMGG